METEGGENANRMLSDKSHCEVRDWLMTRLFIHNSGRSGVATNMIVNEFKEAVYYPGTEENNARYRVDVIELAYMVQRTSGYMMTYTF